MVENDDLIFPDIHGLLKTTKQEGKVMSLVVMHVGHWLNRNLVKAGERESNKPQLRMDFLPALRQAYRDEADKESMELQRLVLLHVKTNLTELTKKAIERYLHEFPTDDGTAYTQRFQHECWHKLLRLVRAFVGPYLQHEALTIYNAEIFRGNDARYPDSTSGLMVAQELCDRVKQLPEVSQNPALTSETAIGALRSLMIKWAAQQCAKALCGEKAQQWEPSQVKHIQAEKGKYLALMSSNSGADEPSSLGLGSITSMISHEVIPDAQVPVSQVTPYSSISVQEDDEEDQGSEGFEIMERSPVRPRVTIPTVADKGAGVRKVASVANRKDDRAKTTASVHALVQGKRGHWRQKPGADRGVAVSPQ
jgi:hypothetical protein